MKKAFTLAEVLITLGIIGIVAAMTLPTLIQNSQQKETVAKLKKINSIMSQAILRSVADNGEISSWGLVSWTNSDEDLSDEENLANRAPLQIFIEKIKPYLKIIAECGRGDKCSFDAVSERTSLDGTAFGTWGKESIVLPDGIVIRGITIYSPSCTAVRGSGLLSKICGEMFIDINGRKGPNATGKDVFLFYITNNGLIPMGTKEEADTSRFNFDNGCNLNRPSTLNGYGCAAWVIYNENLDYLKCSDLSWDGKRKCSK